MKRILQFMILATVVGTLFTACQKESPSSIQDDLNDQIAIEGAIEQSEWILNNADLPSEMQAAYERLEFDVDADLNYSWKWVMKNGTTYDMTGYLYQEKSSHTYESGSGIWNIYVNVLHINGQELPGGWYGIYTYEDENNLILNVEPDVQNWGKHPEAAKGIGSGDRGNQSVYRFSKI